MCRSSKSNDSVGWWMQGSYIGITWVEVGAGVATGRRMCRWPVWPWLLGLPDAAAADVQFYVVSHQVRLDLVEPGVTELQQQNIYLILRSLPFWCSTKSKTEEWADRTHRKVVQTMLVKSIIFLATFWLEKRYYYRSESSRTTYKRWLFTHHFDFLWKNKKVYHSSLVFLKVLKWLHLTQLRNYATYCYTFRIRRLHRLKRFQARNKHFWVSYSVCSSDYLGAERRCTTWSPRTFSWGSYGFGAYLHRSPTLCKTVAVSFLRTQRCNE